MQRTTVNCSICGRAISKSNIAKHEASCKGQVVKIDYTLSHEGLTCQFCGKECKNRNSLCNHERLCKLNPNRQQNVGFDQFNANRKNGNAFTWNKGLTKHENTSVRKQSETLSNYYETHNSSWQGKRHSDETKRKISESRKQYLLKFPDQVPYKLNHSSKESYPEKYFTEVFEKEGLALHKEYYCLGYYLYFCDVAKKIDIEIDGEQHYLDSKIVEHDVVRTATLEAAGWTVFRIRWAAYKTMSDEQKHDVILQIKSLLN